MLFGDVLKNLLDENNLTQKQFANGLNLAASTISSYVQNTRQPDFDTLCRIADFFGVTTDYLLSHNINKNSSSEECELLRVFYAMDLTQQRIYIEQGKAFNKIKQNIE